ncbi:MAG: mannose-1-phosphate guanylyltransferase/mannose-6-phosphate isomerase [Nitrospirae bacterium]|nr:MAG: mannose-1-phosphate guanylyltransferase/mannose-6-phosphate isomerase [Nitrospirota bacterium]
MHIPHLHGVILAGGSGTRFWPLSRERFPKQLLNILGEETLIQQTVRRLLGCMTADRIWIVTNHRQAESIQWQLAAWNDQLSPHIVAEPEGRNTAPAIGLAALRLLQEDPDAIMVVLPADHVITPQRKFHHAVVAGTTLAQADYLVTFGVRPTRPETGYGYIQPSLKHPLSKAGRILGYRVTRFVEKPDSRTARRYLRSGRYFWNSGMFVWKARTIVEELQRHKPALFRALQRVVAYSRSSDTGAFARAYRKLEAVSIDYGVMERSEKTAMIPVDFTWSDVGSWASLPEVMPCDRAGNVMSGNIIDLGSTNSVLFGQQRIVATIGLADMIVVDTPDATLVCPKDRAQDVKKVVEALRARNAQEHREHRTVYRPWGSYTILEEASGYKVKRITVNPGKRLSLQLHHRRSEHWVVIAGRARVTRGEEIFDLHPGQSTAIPRETPHRLENPGDQILEIVEVQNGNYLGEDDIVRLHDDFGRPPQQLG